jgi:glutathione peroxidase
MTIHDFSAPLGTGEDRRLADYRGKVVLIINVASKCGFTPQYNGLQKLCEHFQSRGFEILAFPCDQFGHQEPGSDAEIAVFCDATYGVTFPLFAKIDVNGKYAHPLYVWLKQQKGGLLSNSIKWNFTKLLCLKSLEKFGFVLASSLARSALGGRQPYQPDHFAEAMGTERFYAGSNLQTKVDAYRQRLYKAAGINPDDAANMKNMGTSPDQPKIRGALIG